MAQLVEKRKKEDTNKAQEEQEEKKESMRGGLKSLQLANLLNAKIKPRQNKETFPFIIVLPPARWQTFLLSSHIFSRFHRTHKNKRKLPPFSSGLLY